MKELLLQKNTNIELLFDMNKDCEFIDFKNNLIKYEDIQIKYFYYKDQVYFKARNIAKLLDFSNTKLAIKKNIDKFKKKIFLEGIICKNPSKNIIDFFNKIHTRTTFINESGLYTLIFASKKPEIETFIFKQWITSEVLPSIRKTGNYNIIDNYIEEDLEKYYGKDCLIKNL